MEMTQFPGALLDPTRVRASKCASGAVSSPNGTILGFPDEGISCIKTLYLTRSILMNGTREYRLMMSLRRTRGKVFPHEECGLVVNVMPRLSQKPPPLQTRRDYLFNK